MGIIYLLTNGSQHFKIGITKYSAEIRIKSLQTGNGDTISVVSEFESKYNNRIESALHQRYSSKRLKGEWFTLEVSDVNNFMSDCQTLHEAFETLDSMGNPLFLR